MELRKVGKKGEITIPKPIRDRLKINDGDYVDITLNNKNEIVVIKKD